MESEWHPIDEKARKGPIVMAKHANDKYKTQIFNEYCDKNIGFGKITPCMLLYCESSSEWSLSPPCFHC